jgi:phosphatidylglycerol:prolipoprotein diacylglycerol transferase
VHATFDTLIWITPYGLMLVVALLGGWLYARQRVKAAGLDVSHADLAVPLVFIASLLGARLLTLIIPGDAEFAGELYQAHSRFRLFGLFFAGVPALFVYSRLARLSFRGLLDLFALPVVLWLALLRFGCFMAGCCWGDLTQEHAGLGSIADPRLADQLLTLPWLTGDWLITAVNFPAESLAYQQHLALGLIEPGASSSLSVHPTQLYELLLLVLLLVVLRRVESRWTSPGMVALVTLCAYAALRFIIEFLRADSTLVLGQLTSTQLICIALLLGCAVCMPVLKRATSQ